MYFAIWKSANDEFYWEAIGDNQETMAVSETYTRKTSARHAIEVIKAEAATASVLDCSTEKNFDRNLP